MRNSNRRDTRLVEAALADAVSAARWDWIDLSTRRPDCAHREWILGRASELAMSPIARDQLRSIALERSAEGGALNGPLIDISCASQDRALIAKRIFGLGPHKAAETEDLVRAIEERHSRQLRADASFGRLPELFEQDAVLHESLWDHPALPGSDSVRLAMLCSVPKLRDRVQDLTVLAKGWRRYLGRRLAALSRREWQ
jgi:hypothetical protein